jgi:hypothetical protein
MKKIMFVIFLVVLFLLSVSIAFADECHGKSCDDTPGHECEHGDHPDNPHCVTEEPTDDNTDPTEEVANDPTSEPTEESDDPTEEGTVEPTIEVKITATQAPSCDQYFSLWDIPNLDRGFVGTNLNNAQLLVGYRDGDRLAQPYLLVIPGGNMFYVPEYNKVGTHLWDESVWFAMSRGCGRLHGAQELGLLEN